MCGIFGFVSGKKNDLTDDQVVDTVKDLFTLSESRGREASGFAGILKNEIIVHRTPSSASRMIKSPEFNQFAYRLAEKENGLFSLIGHSRLVTNGYEHFNYNNQPVIKKDMVGVHNGIIVNVDELWANYPDEERETDLDTEIIPIIINKTLSENGDFYAALQDLYRKIYGMTNIAFLFSKFNNLILATNNGSIYYISDPDHDYFIFASEYFILEELIKKNPHLSFIDKNLIKQLEPKTALALNLKSLDYDLKNLQSGDLNFSNLNAIVNPHDIKVIYSNDTGQSKYQNTSMEHVVVNPPQNIVDIFESRKNKIAELMRCTKCILPETFPYIEFDEDGICNFCRNYKKINYRGGEIFAEKLKSYRRNDDRPEVLMPFSGGRDSSYALHYVVKELGLKPLAYSYDWGMITDLARRNQARMCDKLGVEHILISADIRKKRQNIRKNVLAWLKRPHLGTIPLFMAGDKQYFYYANLLMEQNNLDVSILGENLLETTGFKSGFCGISPKFDKEHTYTLSFPDKLKMLGFYGKEFLFNPAYLNSSLLDTLDSFKSYYVIKHQNINIFNYIRWDENIIENLLIDEYDWETDPGTQTTWRIGDGTAAFYNYIYYMVAGFTENDTFRSNQVREGDLDREKALETANTENKPRWDSIQWYCNTIGIDWIPTINKINRIESKF